VAIVAVGIVVAFMLATQFDKSTTAPVVIFATGGALPTLAGSVIRSTSRALSDIRRHMLSMMRSKVDAALELKANETVDPAVEAARIYEGLPGGVRAVVPAFEVRAYIDRVSAEQFVSRIFDQQTVAQPEDLSEVVNSLMRSLPRNPRLHKRMINQIFVQYLVAARRGLLSPGTTVTDSQLAKWAILMARWPEEMAEMLRDFERDGRNVVPPYADNEFAKFFGSEPILDNALGQLAEMTPTKSETQSQEPLGSS
jgi:hypothetical protein